MLATFPRTGDATDAFAKTSATDRCAQGSAASVMGFDAVARDGSPSSDGWKRPSVMPTYSVSSRRLGPRGWRRVPKSDRRPTPVYVSLEEAADCMSVSVKTVRRWIAAGTLPAYRCG